MLEEQSRRADGGLTSLGRGSLDGASNDEDLAEDRHGDAW